MTLLRRAGPAGAPRSAPHGSRGAATVLGVAMAGLLLLLGVALAELTAVVVAHRRAQAAADLAAVAGASSPTDPCAAAERVAAANGALLAACTPEGPRAGVLVAVQVDSPPGLSRVLRIQGHARAGPAP